MLTLLQEITAFLDETGMSPTAFGMKAMNDPPFVANLRNGRDPKESTANKARAFMRDYRTAQSQNASAA